MTLDPDPLDPTDVDIAYAEGWADGWDDSLKPRRFTIRHLVEVAVAVAALASLLGFAVGKASAAPRPTVQQSQPPAHEGETGPGPWTGVPQVEPYDAGSRTPAPPAGIGEPLTGGRSPSPHLRVLPPPKPVAKPPAARPTTGRNGVASWFDSYGSGLYAAVNSYRWGQPRYRMTVCTATRCVRVTVRDFCACGHGRIVDLSRDAFAVLASPSRGLLRVRVVGLR